MSEFVVKGGEILPEEFIDLFQSAGWGVGRAYEFQKVSKALKDTSFTVVARDLDGKVVGCGRAFSDDLFMTFIPDLFVRPEWQRKGIGSRIMEVMKERYGHTVFYFGAQPGKEEFYEKLGFTKGLQSYTGHFKEFSS